MGSQSVFLIWFGWYCVIGIIAARALALSRPKIRRHVESLGAYGRGPQVIGLVALVLTWPLWGVTRTFRLAAHLLHEGKVVAKVKRAFAMSLELEGQIKALDERDPATGAELKKEFAETLRERDKTIAMVVECSSCRKKLEALGIPVPPEE